MPKHTYELWLGSWLGQVQQRSEVRRTGRLSGEASDFGSGPTTAIDVDELVEEMKPEEEDKGGKRDLRDEAYLKAKYPNRPDVKQLLGADTCHRCRRDELPCYKVKGNKKKKCQTCTSGPCSLLPQASEEQIPILQQTVSPPSQAAPIASTVAAPFTIAGSTNVQVVCGRRQGRLESLLLFERDDVKKGLLQACLDDSKQLA